MREASAAFIGGLPFDGFAVGGSLGRSKADMLAVLDWTIPALPEARPRHLLGIGEPEDLFAGIERGIDTFDCVAPTRYARHGVLYTSRGKLSITSAAYQLDPEPIDPDCSCYTCESFSRGYLRHLFQADELLAYTLASIHNLHLIVNLVNGIRTAIDRGYYEDFKGTWLQRYRSGSGERADQGEPLAP